MSVKKTGNNGRFRKGDPRPPGAGRKPGSLNRTTRTVKEAIQAAFDNVGGQKWLEKLAEEDPKSFATLLAKLVPTDVKIEAKPVYNLINALPDPEELEAIEGSPIINADDATD